MTEGNKFRFRPYFKIDGIPTIKNSEIAALYDRVVEEGFADVLFHDGTVNSGEEFVRCMTNPLTLFWIIYICEEEKEAEVGMFWLNRIEKTHAYCHFAGFKTWWGTSVTVQAGKEAMRKLLISQHEPMFETVMGMVPADNSFAIDYLKQVGLTLLPPVPNLLWDEKKQESVTGIFGYITKEDLMDEDLH